VGTQSLDPQCIVF